MWKPIGRAPQNGSIVWVGNSQTGEMRLARWQTHQLIRKEGWFDLLLSEITPQPVRFTPDVFADIPEPPNAPRETDEALVDRLAAIFWEAHRPKMLAIIDRLEHDFE